MDVYEAIHARRDQEAFADDVPDRAVIARVIEAATWAPNHHLTQPWRFHVVAGTRRQLMTGTIASALETTGATEGEVRSMRRKIMRAPVTVFVSQAGEPGDQETRRLEDYAACAAAIQNLLLAAHAERLAAHLSTDRMLEYDAVRGYLGLTEHDRAVAFINLGRLRSDAKPKTGVRNAPVVRWDWD